MRTETAKVNGKTVTIFIPDTPEEAAELQRRAAAGEIEDTSQGEANEPGVVSKRERRKAELAAARAKRPPQPKPKPKAGA
jgi:hypothetical protein